MNEMIRTAILHVPHVDEDAGQAVLTILQQSVDHLILLMEQSVASQRNMVEERLRSWCDVEELDLIITIGGTYPAPGPGSAEIVPQATLAVLERRLPGLAEFMRAVAVEETSYALLDCSETGVRGRTLIVNLPAGESAAVLFLASIAGLIEPTLLHLRQAPTAPTVETDLALQAEEPVATEERHLDADEFAAFLGRHSDGNELD